MRAHHGGIQKHDGQVDTLEPLQQLQDLPPDPTLDPALPAHVDRVPRAVGVWQIPPRRARAQNMQPVSYTHLDVYKRQTQATVRDDASRWCIEPTFSDVKRRGFQLEATQLQAPDRLDRLVLIMALAMHWCVRAGQEEARQHPPRSKKNPGTDRSPCLLYTSRCV